MMIRMLQWKGAIGLLCILVCFALTLVSLYSFPNYFNRSGVKILSDPASEIPRSNKNSPCLNSFAINKRCLPYFTIGGFMKSGTTSLFNYLRQHPLVEGKALHWDYSPNSKRNNINMTTWLQLLPDVYRKGKVVFDKSPTEVTEEVLVRIKALVPNLKIIFIFRNPVKRLISNYWMSVRKKQSQNKTLPDFKRYALKDFEMVNRPKDHKLGDVDCYNRETNSYIDCFRKPNAYISALAKGLYFDRIDLWMRFFPREHLFFIHSEEFALARNRTRILHELTAFLDLPRYDWESIDQLAAADANVRSYPDIESERDGARVLEMVREFYRPQNLRLESFLGRRLGWD